MVCARYTVLAISSLLMLIPGIIHGEEAKLPRTDLYGDPLPPGAVMRLGTIRLRHAGADMTFSKDGKHLISCGGDGEVRVWDVGSGALLRRTQLGFKSAFAQIFLAPGGAMATSRPLNFSSSDVKIPYSLYDTLTGQERHRFAVGTEMLAFSPDGKKLAMQVPGKMGNASVCVWDIVGPQKHLNLDVPPHTSLMAAAFAADGKQLAAIDGEKSEELFVWDAVTGKLRKRKKFRPWMVSLTYASGGTTLAVGLSGKAEAVLLDAATLEEKAVLSAPGYTDGPVRIARLIFSSDDRLLAGDFINKFNSNENSVLLWNLNKPKEPRRLPAAFTFALSPDAKTLASQESEGYEIRLWDVASGRQLQRRPGHDMWVQALAVSANGRLIASSAPRRKQLRLWNAAAGAPLHALQGSEEGIYHCFFSPDGTRLISEDKNGLFQIWDVTSGKELQRISSDWRRQGFSPRVYAAGISADGKRLMAVSGQRPAPLSPGRLLAWDLTMGKLQMQRPYPSQVLNAMQGLGSLDHAAFSPDGELVTVWLGDRVGIEEIATGSLLATLPRGLCWSIQFSPDGRFVKASIYERPNQSRGSGSCLTPIIEVASGEEVLRLNIGEFDHTAFTPDGRAVIATEARRLRVWDILTGERLHEMAWPQEVPHETGGVSIWSLAALPDGRAATGMTEGDILVWDLAPEKWPRPKPVLDLGRKGFDVLWSDLARDARTAYRAVSLLAASPAWSVPLLDNHLYPVALDSKRIERLIADLDDDQYEVREKASSELPKYLCAVEPKMQRALADKPSLELRRRLENILAEPKHPTAEKLRMRRAIAVLERIGTPEARRIVKKLAGGAASPETREAQRALQRLKYR